MNETNPKEKFMLRAIELAKRGAGRTNPNPLVGAVIVKDGTIIAEGYHAAYGKLHAERAALTSLGDKCDSAQGSDMYVTLEPCCHYGKQPPCTDAIIKSGIKHVIIGSRDPNPLVAGKGVAILKDNGINVTEDFMINECDELNSVFFHFITTGLPYVIMKYAMTADGKIATVTGASKWVTGELARRTVHEERNRCQAIMVGVGTILKDNPLLTCRIPDGRNPIRIICDSNLRTPLNSRIVTTASEVRTIIATCRADHYKQEEYVKLGCEVIEIPSRNGRVDLNELMEMLGEEKIDSILLEGGGELNSSALKSGIVNKMQIYVAPKIFGGVEAPSPVGGEGVALPDDATVLSKPCMTPLGDDLLIEYEVKDVHRNN